MLKRIMIKIKFFFAMLAMLALIVPALPQAAGAADYLDPYDEDTHSFLSELGIKLDPADPLWQDDDFISLINAKNAIENNAMAVIDYLIEIYSDAFEMIRHIDSISDPKFDDYNLAEEDRELLDEMKQSMIDELEALKNDKDELIESLFDFDFYDFADPDFDYESDYLYVYAWSDYYYDETPQPGKIVWLYSEYDNPEGGEVDVSWEQTDGPEVTWLNTDSQTGAAFIMPAYEDTDYEYLEFKVTVDNGVETDYSYVTFYLYDIYEELDSVPELEEI